MADENEDQWLYGDSDSVSTEKAQDSKPEDEKQQNDSMFENQEDSSRMSTGDVTNETSVEPGELPEDESQSNEPSDSQNGEKAENGSDSKKEDGNLADNTEAISESDSDDDVHVVIDNIKLGPAQYSNINIKRGGLMSSTSGGVSEKLSKQSGKFSIDEFETIGSINGIPAHEFNLDQLEDKPWRQPGADITDYFNYGFNEDTWRAYCERQKRMRSESGVGLILNASGGPGGGNPTGPPGSRVPQVMITNYNSKYSGMMGPKRAGPPPGRKMAGTIDVIGSTGLASRRNLDKSPQKENVIQVMTADRREYSRKPGFPDMSVPPPGPALPPSFDMPPPGYQIPEPTYFVPEIDPYYQSYEPTQDRQWGNDPTWQTNNLSIPLTGGDDSKNIPTMVPPTQIHHQMMRDRDMDRERDKDSSVRERENESMTREDDRDRERARSQYRHKERHRHRSRSRSRRHKSKSRSPSRRKKKSRRSDRERSKEDSD